MYDKLIRDILDYPQKLINKLGIKQNSTKIGGESPDNSFLELGIIYISSLDETLLVLIRYSHTVSTEIMIIETWERFSH